MLTQPTSLKELQLALERTIKLVLERDLAQKRELLIGEVVAAFNKEVREKVGKAAVEVSKLYSIETSSHELVIRVRLE